MLAHRCASPFLRLRTRDVYQQWEKSRECRDEARANEEEENEISRWHQRDTTMWSNFSPSCYHNDQDSHWRGVVWALKAVLNVIRAREAYKKYHKHEIGTIFHFKLSHVITLPFVTRYVDDLFLSSIRCDVICFPRPLGNIMQRLFCGSTCHRPSRSLHFFFGCCQNNPRFNTAQVALKRRNPSVFSSFVFQALATIGSKKSS